MISSGILLILYYGGVKVKGREIGEPQEEKPLQLKDSGKVLIMANFMDYGFSGTISKPFQLKNLQEVISNIFGAE